MRDVGDILEELRLNGVLGVVEDPEPLPPMPVSRAPDVASKLLEDMEPAPKRRPRATVTLESLLARVDALREDIVALMGGEAQEPDRPVLRAPKSKKKKMQEVAPPALLPREPPVPALPPPPPPAANPLEEMRARVREKMRTTPARQADDEDDIPFVGQERAVVDRSNITSVIGGTGR